MPSADSQSQQQDLLPTDYQYTWANDSYSKGQRTRDTWTFVLLLRARLWLLDQVSGRTAGVTVVGVGRRCCLRVCDSFACCDNVACLYVIILHGL